MTSAETTPIPDDPRNAIRILRTAEKKTRAEQWAEAAVLWDQVVAGNPVNGTFWLQSGLAHYHTNQYRKAINAFEQCLKLGGAFPSPAAYEHNFPWRIAFEIVRCYAMLGETEPALQWMEQSLALGWHEREPIANDTALASLINHPRFRDLIGREYASDLERDDRWRYDLALLARECKRLHYAPFQQISEQTYDAMVQQLHDDIPYLSDAHIFVAMMKLMRQLGDGHSMVSFWQERPEFRSAPMMFAMFAEGVLSTAAAPAYAEWLGMQVIRVGEHPIESVITTLDQIISQDNPMWQKLMGPFFLQQPYLLHGLGLIPDATTLPITLRAADGALHELNLPAEMDPILDMFGASPPEDWATIPRRGAGDIPLYLRNAGAYWFEYLPQEKTVYFQYQRVREDANEPFSQFCQRMFAFIEHNDVERLIIDLRRNPGGNTLLVHPLLLGLLQSQKINQHGRLFVVIGRNTFSAAQNTATLIEDYTNAIFVGEPTGANPNFIGETTMITLPYSQIQVSISDLYWQTSWPLDHRRWIAPRIYAPPTFAAYAANRDLALEAIFAYEASDQALE